MKTLFAVLLGICSLTSCQPTAPVDTSNYIQKSYGHWITEPSGDIMLDPQPSGLTHWRGKLLTLSDRSAHVSQRLTLRGINQEKAKLNGPNMKIVLSQQAQQSCFASYMSDNPDLEALTVDPDDDQVFYFVTEDGSYADPMPSDCQNKYQQTGSTSYPTLLIRAEMASNSQVIVTQIRPIQFTQEMQVGDFPNDGIEALAFGQNRTLYLGIEKDQNKKAQVFSLVIDEAFWQSEAFAQVKHVPLQLPQFKSGNHPINGMDYYQTTNGDEFLILAARNDETLWVADLTGKNPAKIVPLEFYAEIINGTGVCKDFEPMDNTSIEGIAIIKDTLWMVNDPWKAVYLNNIRCPQNKRNYQKFAPLLFSVPINPNWFNSKPIN